MSTVGWSTLDVIPTVKNLRSQLEAQTSRDFAAAGRTGGQRFGEAAGTEATKGFKARFSGGQVVREAFAPALGILAGAGIVEGLKRVLDAGSDTVETANAIKVIFGDAATQVERFAGDSTKNILLTKQAAEDAAATFGTFGKAAGLTGSELATFSDSLVGLSSDLSSFKNKSTDQAIQAIGAGLRGESEPLREFGVLLDDATLRQEALRQGLIKTTTQALTPQQRVLAAYQVILAQTKDAQGDAARTQDGYANATRKLQKELGDMVAELGTKVVPTAARFAVVAGDDVLPAVRGVGGVVSDTAHAFGELPGPVKGAAGAFVAFKAAQSVGLLSAVSSGASAAGSAMVGLRIRALLARDAFVAESASANRLTASLAGARAGATGLSTSLAGAAKSAGAIAVIAGAFELLQRFQPDEAAASRYVETIEALGGPTLAGQIESVTKAIEEQKKKAGDVFGPQFSVFGTKVSPFEFGSDWKDANVKVKDLKDALADLKHQQELAAIASRQESSATQSLAGQYDAARSAVKGLLDAENKRRNALLGMKEDQLGLAQSLADARTEAGKGARTLDLNTQAGRDNQRALLELASTWNDAAGKVRNAKGAYADMRDNFVKVAESMGGSRTEAQKLADRLLSLPKRRAIEIDTPGMKAALRDLRDLRSGLLGVGRIVITAQAAKNQAALADIRRATGGPIFGPGTGTSDSILIRASNGEFMQPKASVDYYGPGFMEKVRRRELPRYADGGQVGASSSGSGSPVGHEIVGVLSWDTAGMLALRGVIREEISASTREATRARTLSASDGIRR